MIPTDEIYQKWYSLLAKKEQGNQYHSEALYSDNIVELINIADHPVIFVKKDIGTPIESLYSEMLEIDFHRRLRLIEDSLEYIGVSITFKKNDIESVKAFLGTIWLLLGNGGVYNQSINLQETLRDFVLIMGRRSQDIRDAIGLWGELFIIHIQPDSQIARFSSSWRSNPRNKFDFSFDNSDLEVKTTLKPERIHHLSQTQLRPSGDRKLTFASILLREQENGMSLFDLITHVAPLLSKEKSHEALADIINSASSNPNLLKKFSEAYARDNLKYIIASRIPRPIIREQDQGFVSGVEFTTNLTQLVLDPKNIEMNPSGGGDVILE